MSDITIEHRAAADADAPIETLDEFRARVAGFFSLNAPRAETTSTAWGDASDRLVAAGMSDDHDDVAAARRFQAALFDAGLAWLTGPKEYGGAELGAEHVRAFREVASEYAAADTFCLMIGQQIVAPAVLAFGTDAQKRRWVPALRRGDVVGCQLFSEPDAGSDLASVRTRAVRDGDGWRINGQKVWTSGAHTSDVGELLARTEDDASLRNRGLTMFLVDMDAPGVTVKPLRQMSGSAHFNEVFLNDVFVSDDRRIGPRGGGWAVANASLTSERSPDAHDEFKLFIRPFERLLQLAAERGDPADAVLRQRLARAYTDHRIDGFLPRYLESVNGGVGAVAPSIVKLRGAQSLWDLTNTADEVLGLRSVVDDGEWGHYCWAELTLMLHSQRIAGGTNEIQRNIIAERGLGLPREPRP